MNLLKRLWETCKQLFPVTLTVLVLLIILLSLSEYFLFDVLSVDPEFNKSTKWHALILIPLTFFILCAAWMQFKGLNKTSKGEFLLRIDERYGSKEIIKARQMIHNYYLDTYSVDIDIHIHVKKISSRVLEEKNNKNQKEFIYLLNFLDFLETVAYFTNNNYMSLDDVDELIGSSLKYYFCVFKELILNRRKTYRCKKYYCEIEQLAKDIQKKNPNIPPFVSNDS